MVSLVENLTRSFGRFNQTDRPQKRPTLWRVLTENSGTLVSNFAMFLPLRKTIFHIYIYNHISFQPSSYFIIAPPFFIEILGPTVVSTTCSALSNATCRSRRCPRKEPKEAENLRVQVSQPHPIKGNSRDPK